ncbi:MAG: hypothetical protein PHW40_03745 [Candidatus Izemoplasmatales bacterium]|nr:hypothetical protein [Candidatus Izemoplasmatales bacterium]
MTYKEKCQAVYEAIKDEKGEVFDEIRHILGVSNQTTALTTKSKRFVKPTIAEVVGYCEERKNGIDGEAFWYFYESKGWVIGKSPMKNWKMAVATWEKKNKQVSRSEKQRLMDIMNKTGGGLI